MKQYRSFFIKLLPFSLRSLILNYHMRNYSKLSTKDIFLKIYQDNAWGKSFDPDTRFYSGYGSHNQSAIKAYTNKVGEFLLSLKTKPSVADLGCGDFNVGAHLLQYCGKYTACDIVPSLITNNKHKYKDTNVQFEVMDIVIDELPTADIAFIRQVFQHLSNELISQALLQLTNKYKYIIITEHLPKTSNFIPNINKPTGPNTRLSLDSGVVITAPPFNFQYKLSKTLCSIDDGSGIIETTLYEL